MSLAWRLKSLFLRVFSVVAMLLSICGEPLAASAPSDIVTQAEFAASLLNGLGWQGGLPAEPKTDDYLAVLSGKRAFSYEAEDVYNAQADSVTVRNYPLHGPFSGTGWLSGTSEPTMVRFTVFIPRGGEYLLRVVSKGDGQRWQAGGRELTVSTGGTFSEAGAGMVILKEGSQEISVLLPPEGGVDSFRLVASGAHPAIEPLDGWHPDAALTWGDYAETIAAALDLEKGFATPTSVKPRIIAFQSSATLPPSAVATTVEYLGVHVAPKWVRAGVDGAAVDLPFDVVSTGVYGVRARLLGSRIITDLEGRLTEHSGKQYLDWYDLGIVRLNKGTHTLRVQLPPFGGADVAELTARPSAPADYLAAIGLGNKQASAKVTRAELEEQIRKDLSRIRPSR